MLTAASTPKITMTTTSSIIVKPRVRAGPCLRRVKIRVMVEYAGDSVRGETGPSGPRAPPSLSVEDRRPAAIKAICAGNRARAHIFFTKRWLR
jgi:hypothetical protein